MPLLYKSLSPLFGYPQVWLFYDFLTVRTSSSLDIKTGKIKFVTLF